MIEKKLTREEAKAEILEALEHGEVAYQCCFCHMEIKGSIHALIFVANWDGPEEQQKAQQWFCHTECFINATGRA